MPLVHCHDSSVLMTYAECPQWLRDNDCVHRGYRVHYSFRACAASFLRLHNESLNVWTHTLGGLLFVLLLCLMWLSPTPFGTTLLADRISLASTGGALNLSATPGTDLHHHESILHYFAQKAKTHSHGFAQLASALDADAHGYCGSVGCVLTHPCGLGNLIGRWFVPDRLAQGLQAAMARMQDTIHAYAPSEQLAAGRAAVQDALHAMEAALTRRVHTSPRLEEFLAAGRHAAVNMQQSVAALQLAAGGYDNPPGHSLVQWPIVVLLGCGLFTFIMSTACHLFFCHSPATCSHMCKLDYLGIGFLISGSQVPFVYYGLFCRPGWVLFYLLLNGTTVILVSIACFSELMMRPAFRKVRALLFSFSGALAFFPFRDILMLDEAPSFLVPDILLIGGAYLVGALLFGSRIPERWLPGTFDFVGSSHQWFHVCVIIGALGTYSTIVKLYEWRQLAVCH